MRASPVQIDSARSARRQVAILCGEPDRLTMEGFRSVVGRLHRIVGTARDGLDLVNAAIRLKPELIILSISLPRLNGIEAARLIKTKLHRTKIVFMTRHDGPSFVQKAIAAGADGYLLKSDDPERLLEAIDNVMAGQAYFSPQLSADCLTHRRQSGDAADKLDLTTRERQVLQQIAEGHGAKQIAGALHISIKTVSFHRENIKRKLGVRTTADLTRLAIGLGLIPPPDAA